MFHTSAYLLKPSRTFLTQWQYFLQKYNAARDEKLYILYTSPIHNINFVRTLETARLRTYNIIIIIFNPIIL